MKKFFACFLALTLVIGVMPMAFSADYVAEKTTTSLTINVEATKEDEQVIVKIKIPANSYLAQGEWELTYDKEVLSYNEEDTLDLAVEEDVRGAYDFSTESRKIGYMTDYRTVAAITLAVIVFDITTTTVENTTITLKTVADQTLVCDEADKKGEDCYEVPTPVADITKVVKINDVEAPTATTTEPESEDELTPDEANEIAEKIKECIKRVGLEALLDNPTISGIIDQIGAIIGGEFDFEEFLNNIDKIDLNDLGIANIFQGLLDAIESIFGGGTTTTTKKTSDDQDDDVNDVDDDDSAEEDDDGENAPGDKGIALAAAVCIAAAAAFVIAKKKKRD